MKTIKVLLTVVRLLSELLLAVLIGFYVGNKVSSNDVLVNVDEAIVSVVDKEYSPAIAHFVCDLVAIKEEQYTLSKETWMNTAILQNNCNNISVAAIVSQTTEKLKVNNAVFVPPKMGIPMERSDWIHENNTC